MNAQKIRVRMPAVLIASPIRIPGSKSYSVRACILASLSSSPSKLTNFPFSDDSNWALNCLENLGFLVSTNEDLGEVSIRPPVDFKSTAKLFLGMAGTVGRFIPATILNFEAIHKKPITAALEASESLSKRPMEPLFEALRRLGAQIDSNALPCTIRSSKLSGKTKISGKVSGQFLSGLILAAAGCRNEITIEIVDDVVQPGYVDMTVQALKAFGANIAISEDRRQYSIVPSVLKKETFAIEEDASTACYFHAFSLLHEFDLKLSVPSHSLQPDYQFLKFLEALKKASSSNQELHWDFKPMSDQALTAGVMGFLLGVKVTVRNVAHIRHHESDRIKNLCQNFLKLGCVAEEYDDGFCIHPQKIDLSGLWETHEDHRFAMCGFLLASKYPELLIDNPHCVSKSAPSFFKEFEKLGINFILQ